MMIGCLIIRCGWLIRVVSLSCSLLCDYVFIPLIVVFIILFCLFCVPMECNSLLGFCDYCLVIKFLAFGIISLSLVRDYIDYLHDDSGDDLR